MAKSKGKKNAKENRQSTAQAGAYSGGSSNLTDKNGANYPTTPGTKGVNGPSANGCR